jgi:IS605 OrfB family transposase
MSSAKRVLTIRISGKERKEKVRRLLYDLAHLKNMLIILIRGYKEKFDLYPLDISLLYGLLAKEYTGKKQEKFEKFLENIKSDEELSNLLKNLKLQKEKIENASLVQSVIRQTVKDFKSYLKALKVFRGNSERFMSAPQPPKPKKLKFLMNFSGELNLNAVKREGDRLIIRLRSGKFLKVKLPKEFPYRVSSVRLKIFGEDLYVDVVYEYRVQEMKPKGEYKAGIDVGLDELLSVVSDNPSFRSFIVSGREIKAFNQWFNKERGKLRSQIDYLRNGLKEDNYEEEDERYLKKKLRELEIRDKVLSAHRKRWIETQLHRIARKVVEVLYETGHRTIYVGRNALESKNGINLGRKINQEFVFIPFRRLVELIRYKAEELGIGVVEVDESYTSKTSPFVDIIEVQRTKKRELCKGERKGNLFKDRVVSRIFHADLVGALNILRVGAKLPRLNFYEDSKILFVKLCNPMRLKLMDLFFKVTSESLLGIGGSRQGILVPAGLSLGTVRSNHLDTFCS